VFFPFPGTSLSNPSRSRCISVENSIFGGGGGGGGQLMSGGGGVGRKMSQPWKLEAFALVLRVVGGG